MNNDNLNMENADLIKQSARKIVDLKKNILIEKFIEMSENDVKKIDSMVEKELKRVNRSGKFWYILDQIFKGAIITHEAHKGRLSIINFDNYEDYKKNHCNQTNNKILELEEIKKLTIERMGFAKKMISSSEQIIYQIDNNVDYAQEVIKSAIKYCNAQKKGQGLWIFDECIKKMGQNSNLLNEGKRVNYYLGPKYDHFIYDEVNAVKNSIIEEERPNGRGR